MVPVHATAVVPVLILPKRVQLRSGQADDVIFVIPIITGRDRGVLLRIEALHGLISMVRGGPGDGPTLFAGLKFGFRPVLVALAISATRLHLEVVVLAFPAFGRTRLGHGRRIRQLLGLLFLQILLQQLFLLLETLPLQQQELFFGIFEALFWGGDFERRRRSLPVFGAALLRRRVQFHFRLGGGLVEKRVLRRERVVQVLLLALEIGGWYGTDGLFIAVVGLLGEAFVRRGIGTARRRDRTGIKSAAVVATGSR